MARMIPDYIHSDCTSSAEKKLFERFRKELSDKYVVLHSLGLAKHAYKPWAEIDFVVVSRQGLLCVEVKGGRIRQEAGKWYFTNRYGEVNVKKESPFAQSKSGMFALRGSIWKRFGKKSPQGSSVFGYSVIFPDQPFKTESPEWDLLRLIEKKRAGELLEPLIKEQFDYSTQETWRTKKKECTSMTQDQMGQLLSYLRPDVEIIPSLSSRIGEAHDNILRLTEEQFDVLDQQEDNERTLIRGGAGSGKTLLAVEKVRREVANGRKVMFVCYNALLARHVRGILSSVEADNMPQVSTLHGFTRKLISRAGLDDCLPEKGDHMLFTKTYPELFERAFVELYEKPPFDVLVVDEGQDLKAGYMIRMLDWLLQGGFRDGRWTWFEDSQQNIFRPEGENIGQHVLKEYHPAMCRLTKNCRNTKPISIFNSLATATDRQKCLVDNGLTVTPIFYKSNDHQLKQLENILTRLLGGGVRPEDIVLLSPFIKEKSVIKDLDQIKGVALRPYENPYGDYSKSLRYVTIQKFKGLESMAVVVTDITELEAPEVRSLNYVAFSRPTSCLEVLIHEKAEEQFGNLAYMFGKQT